MASAQVLAPQGISAQAMLRRVRVTERESG